MEAPHITKLHEKYKDRGLVVLAVNAWDEDEETIRSFMKSKKLAHPVLLNGRSTYYEVYRSRGVPKTYWIDREGKVVGSHLGFSPGDEKEFEKMIESLL